MSSCDNDLFHDLFSCILLKILCEKRAQIKKLECWPLKQYFIVYTSYTTQMPMFNNDWFLWWRCNNILENPYRVYDGGFLSSHTAFAVLIGKNYCWKQTLVYEIKRGRHDRVVAVIILLRFFVYLPTIDRCRYLPPNATITIYYYTPKTINCILRCNWSLNGTWWEIIKTFVLNIWYYNLF